MSGKTGANQIPRPPGTKQGIVTILGGADSERSNNKPAAASIRRTLSADMSSRKWLHGDGYFFSPSPAKTKFPSSSSSSASYSSSSSSSEEEFDQTLGQDEVWRSIESANNRARERAKAEPWVSILSQKSESFLLPPPYVHPLVKRSSFGSMSERSLEICTESLGSETGSDCYFHSERSIECPNEVYCENERPKEYRYDRDPYADLHVVKYKNVPVMPIPLASSGPHYRFQSRREDGRLILEATPAMPRNNFRALREGGRLVLTLVGGGERTTVGEQIEGDREDMPLEEVVDGGKGEEFVEENRMSLSSVAMGLPEKSLVMKTFLAIGNVRAAWTCTVGDEISVPPSLPVAPRVIPPTTGVPSLNVYEYFWKNKITGLCSFVSFILDTGLTSPMISVPEADKIFNNDENRNRKVYQNWDLVIKKGNKEEHLVPYLRGCKESRRSMLNWEPYCIATS